MRAWLAGALSGILCVAGAFLPTTVFAQDSAVSTAAQRDIDRANHASVERTSAPVGSGQSAGIEEKIRELERRLNEITPTGMPSSGSSGQSPARAESTTNPVDGSGPRVDLSGLAAPAMSGFKDGFIIRSSDRRHQLRITGQLQADYRTFPQPGDTTDIDTFLVRRARLGIEANVFDHYEFRLLPEWGVNRPSIQDAFMNVRYWDEFQFQVGKFKQPVSYEQLIQDRFVPTLERSLIDQIVPARDVGLMVHGQKLFQDRLDYALGVFNGEPNGDIDTNDLRDVSGRLAWRPLNRESLPEFVRPVQVGISGSVGKEAETLNFNGSITPYVIRTPSGIPWLTFNSRVRADGLRTRATPELSYLYQSFGFAAQFIRMDQDMRSGVPIARGSGSRLVIVNDPVQNIRFEGYYFLATYLVTGETRTTYSQPVRPLRPFDPLHPIAKPGAWELVARVSHLQVDPAIFQAGAPYNLADPRTNSNAATEMTLGFNWYLNALVRMQFNWEHAWYQQPVLLGPPSTVFRQTDAVLLRLQIIF